MVRRCAASIRTGTRAEHDRKYPGDDDGDGHGNRPHPQRGALDDRLCETTLVAKPPAASRAATAWLM